MIFVALYLSFIIPPVATLVLGDVHLSFEVQTDQLLSRRIWSFVVECRVGKRCAVLTLFTDLFPQVGLEFARLPFNFVDGMWVLKFKPLNWLWIRWKVGKRAVSGAYSVWDEKLFLLLGSLVGNVCFEVFGLLVRSQLLIVKPVQSHPVFVPHFEELSLSDVFLNSCLQLRVLSTLYHSLLQLLGWIYLSETLLLFLFDL